MPAEWIAGDSVDWAEEEADYPAPDYMIRYSFAADNQSFQVESVPDGTAHLVTLDPSVGDSVVPGEYEYQRAIITVADDARYTTGRGRLVIHPNYDETNAGHDFRSWAEQTRAAVDAVLADKATRDQASYSIAGRSLSRYSVQELTDLRDYLSRIIARERRKARIKAGGKSGNRILSRFPSGRI